MVDIIFELHFEKEFKKIKDSFLKEKIIKQVMKIKDNLKIGKPMRYIRRGTRELYVAPFRLSYQFDAGVVYILALYHKDEQ